MNIESKYHPYNPSKIEMGKFEHFAWDMYKNYGNKFSREALIMLFFEHMDTFADNVSADYIYNHFEEIDRDEFCDRYEVNFHRSPEDQPDEEDEGELTYAIEQYALRNLDFYGWVPSHESLIICI